MEKNNGQAGFNFLDRLAFQNLTSYESRVLLVIIKWHLVYKNGGVAIAISRICELTRLDHGHACRALRGLLRKQILFKSQKNHLNFYSFTSPIGASPIRASEDDLDSPIQAHDRPIKARDYINRSNEVKNNNAGSADGAGSFTDQYPGSWYKSVRARAEKIFAGMSPEDQKKALKALTAYKTSKSVRDGRIFSPVNFLKDPEILDRYAKESAPLAPPVGESMADQVDQWRREQAADPPRGNFRQEFEKIVNQTAESKAVTKGGKS